MALESGVPVLAAYGLAVDLHIWGRPGAERAGILGDIERYQNADWIWQEVRRAIHIASRGMNVQIVTADFANDTEKLRYGEAIAVRLQVASFPVFDASSGVVAGPLGLNFTTSIKPPGV